MNKLATAGVGLALLLAGCSSGSSQSSSSQATATTATASTKPEPVRRHIVPLPASVTAPQNPSWSSDGSRIVFSASPKGSKRVEVYTVKEDGSDLRCLSCSAKRTDDQPLLKPFPFADGRRVLLRVGNQTPVKAAHHAILECLPSVAACEHATILPIDAPSAHDPTVTQDQRELRISPDDHTIGLTQIRSRPNGDTGYAAAVGQLTKAGDHYDITDARVVSDIGELKKFTPDGKGVIVTGFTTLPQRAADPEEMLVDLASGKTTRLTYDGDYDEDFDFSPDQQWYVVGSGRAAELFETVSQVRRPNFIGQGFAPLLGYLFVHHRAELLEPWLVHVGAEQRGAKGQQLDPNAAKEGYDARVPMSWNPAGDAILYWEATNDPFDPASAGSRIVVDHLTSRKPGKPVQAADSPVPTWAPKLAGYRTKPFPALPSRRGRKGGSATVTRTPHDDGSVTISVRYDHFTDDGEWIVSGTESARVHGAQLGESIYTADLTLSGPHTGYLRADHVRISPGAMDGSITSDVDGHELKLPR